MSQLYETLKKRLKVCKLTTAKDELNIRCPFCLDSVKDPFKGHMYIENNPPFRYYCQRCNASGRVNKKYLSLLDIEDRLGIKINDEDISRYKIVYNLNEFLNINKLTSILNKNAKNFYFMKNIETINKNCVGFLSHDKSTIIFRSLDKNITGYRYNNFTIFPELDSKKTYMLSNNINLANKEYNIIITEGIFDIIGVFNHIYNKQISDNMIFMANAVKSYIVTANLLKKLSILNSDKNIYSDGDVDINFYKELMKKEIYFGCNGINLYYNRIGKDFGVTKDQIQLSTKIEL